MREVIVRACTQVCHDLVHHLNNITADAYPTNPESPNGETVVTIVYWARDDKSGVGVVTYRLLDPQGNSHFEYHYHDNFYTTFFVGDPTVHHFTPATGPYK